MYLFPLLPASALSRVCLDTTIRSIVALIPQNHFIFLQFLMFFLIVSETATLQSYQRFISLHSPIDFKYFTQDYALRNKNDLHSVNFYNEQYIILSM